jgi:hypothetical protein
VEVSVNDVILDQVSHTCCILIPVGVASHAAASDDGTERLAGGNETHASLCLLSADVAAVTDCEMQLKKIHT